MRPGEEIYDYLLLENKSSNEKVRFIIFPADIITKYVNPKKETVLFKEKSDNQTEVGSWIKVQSSNERVTLKPNDDLAIPFSIKIPKDVKNGTYYGAVIALNNKNLGQDKSSGIKAKAQIAVLVTVNITDTPINNTAEMFKNETWPLLSEVSYNYYSIGAIFGIALLTIIIIFSTYRIIKSKGFLTGVDTDKIPYDN